MALIELLYAQKAMAEKEHPTEDSKILHDAKINLQEIKSKLAKPLSHKKRVAALQEVFNSVYGEEGKGFGADTFKSVISKYDSDPKTYDYKSTVEKVMIICEEVKNKRAGSEFKSENEEFVKKAEQEFAVYYTLKHLKEQLKDKASDKILWNSLSLFKFDEIKKLLNENSSDLKAPISYDKIKDDDPDKKSFEEHLNEPNVKDTVKMASIQDFLEEMKMSTINELLKNSNPNYSQEQLKKVLMIAANYCKNLAKFLNDEQKTTINEMFEGFKSKLESILQRLKKKDIEVMNKLDEAIKKCSKELEYLESQKPSKENAEANIKMLQKIFDKLNIV